MSDQPTAVVYYVYDGDDLRYIGCTTNLEHRLKGHRNQGTGGVTDNATITTSERLPRRAATALEANEIRRLRPALNITHNRDTTEDPVLTAQAALPVDTPMGLVLSIVAAAARAGFVRSTVDTYRAKGIWPPEDGRIGGSPFWYGETVDAFMATRRPPGQPRKTPKSPQSF